jgi:two-component system response regulator AtoC
MATQPKLVPERMGEVLPDDVIFGQTAEMQTVRQRVLKVCGTNIPLLLLGDSGTGKEVLARFIHSRSLWSDGQFVKVNCAAIPGPLLESELFGYERGAFTGANSTKPGRAEVAHHGTLFLDEISELDLGLQAKLLQLLQDGQFTRIGAQEERHVEARIICATGRDLQAEIERGHFRSDLYYRINVINIRMPRLRERREDIVAMANHYREVFNARFLRDAPQFSMQMMQILQSRDWPGNIRELENWVARYVLLGSEEVLHPESTGHHQSLASYKTSDDGSIPLKRIARDAIREMERRVILQVLQANHWNRRRTAEVLKISYRALIYKIREAGLTKRSSTPAVPAHAPELPGAPHSKPAFPAD